MLRVAITGNIASGKSTVQKFLEEKGYKVLDTDNVAHELLDSMPEIKKTFANLDIWENGKISREKLGKIVFSDQKVKAQLESIIHPAIKEKIQIFFKKNESEPVAFVGIPLLFETNMKGIFDKALLIYTDDKIRLQRLLSRNQYTLEYATKRLQSQISQDEKVKFCEYVIYNNGTISELQKSTNDFLSKL